MARMQAHEMTDLDRIGKLSPYTCPSCHGALWQVDDEHLLRFRCHTGHSFAGEQLSESQADNVEDALFAAARALEESARLAEAIATRSRQDDRPLVADAYERKARDAGTNADTIRALLMEKRAAR